MIPLFAALASAAFASASVSASASFVPPAALAGDLLLENGIVVVAADAPPAGERASVLIRAGVIAFVGDPARARAQAAGAAVVDLRGAFVFPGFADAHVHLLGVGKALEVADLRGAANAEEAAERMARQAAALPAGAWVEGSGWDQNLWPGGAFPTAAALDRAVPGRPAIARRVDGHAVWASSAALAAAGITAATRDPEGGRILRAAGGAPSGVLVDNAMALLQAALPKPGAADFERQFLAGARACAGFGLTEVQDASAYDRERLGVLERLADDGRLPIRVYATVSPEPDALAAAFSRGKRIGGGANLLTVRAVKAYADGALGSRGAALLEDYADEPGWRGLLVTPPERLAAIATDARRNGWQLWIHAIGDRGNRVALEAFEKAAAAVPRAPSGGDRPRVEHAQVIAPDDFARFARDGVIASIQPTHATSDMPWAADRLGPSRITGAYAWRRLRDAGVRLAGGSDAPVESENPLLGFYAAVTRQDPAGVPPGGWYSTQRLSRAEALALFTKDAAYAAFEEKSRGRIAPGFAGDLTILDRNPMTVPESEIPRIARLWTIVAGRVAAGVAGRVAAGVAGRVAAGPRP